METICSNAARLNEILPLKITHLRLKASKPHITVVGKGDKNRTLNLSPKTVSHLQAYIADAHEKKPSPDS
jgi:site-specific recombinase XerC